MDKDKALALALETLEESLTYIESPSWSPSMGEDCRKAIAAIKQAQKVYKPIEVIINGDLYRISSNVDGSPIVVFVAPSPSTLTDRGEPRYVRTTAAGLQGSHDRVNWFDIASAQVAKP